MYNPIPVTANRTLSGSDGNAVLYLNVASGATVTLPASSGSGRVYKFVVGTTVTSNNYAVKVANATDVMIGNAILAQDAGDTAVAFEAGATADTITLNGTTTGGIKGDAIELIDVASGVWFAQVRGSATGTEATPFSATVS